MLQSYPPAFRVAESVQVRGRKVALIVGRLVRQRPMLAPTARPVLLHPGTYP